MKKVLQFLLIISFMISCTEDDINIVAEENLISESSILSRGDVSILINPFELSGNFKVW